MKTHLTIDRVTFWWWLETFTFLFPSEICRYAAHFFFNNLHLCKW